MIGAKRPERSTIERWTRDCLDVVFLRRAGFLDGGWVTIGGTLKWPRVARLRIARYVSRATARDASAHIPAAETRGTEP
jgi:hypothetical protein